MIVATLCAQGCTSEVGLRFDVSSSACGGALVDESLRWLWGISEGECGVQPGPVVHAGSLDDLGAVALPEGRFCFWGLAVAQDCQVVAGVSTSRRLPAQDGRVTLRFDEASCVEPAEEASWDGAAEAFASCTPSCSARRCACSRAESCAVGSTVDRPDGGTLLTASDATCPAPITADVLAVGPSHACAGTLGAEGLWCWGLGSAETGPVRTALPTVEGSETRLARLAVGEGRTCVAMETAVTSESAESETSWIWCREQDPDDSGPWVPLGRPAPRCESAIGRIDTRSLVVGGTDEDSFVCAVSANVGGAALVCWGGANPLRTDTEHPRAGELIDCAFEGNDGPLLVRVDRGVRRVAAGDRHVCFVGAAGSLECWGIRTADVGCGSDQPIDDVLVSGDVTCVLDAGRRFCCDGGRFETFGVLEASVFAQGPGAFGCLRRAGTTPFCSQLGSEDAVFLDTLSAFAGRGVACGIGTGGVVKCVRLSESAVEIGTRFTSPERDLICPPTP